MQTTTYAELVKRALRSGPAHALAIALALGICGIAALIAGMAITGGFAAVNLWHLRTELSSAQSSLQAGSLKSVAAQIPTWQGQAGKARAWTWSPVWNVAARTPVLGRTVQSLQQTVLAVSIAVNESVAPLGQAASQTNIPVKGAVGGTVSLLRSVEPVAGQAQAGADRATAAIGSAPTTGVFPVVNTARIKTQTQLEQLDRIAAAAATASKVAPVLLGEHQPQSYFVGFTSPAEARGTGGFLGTFAIVTITDGNLKIDHVGSNIELVEPKKQTVDLGEQYTENWGKNNQLWSGMNISPHFPYAAQQWIAAWKLQTGQQLDGAMSVDPTALAYFVGATGPVQLPDGSQLIAKDVVPFVTRGIYTKFNGDSADRKKFQEAVVTGALEHIAQAGPQAIPLTNAIGRAASERRLLIYSRDRTVERELSKWPISGSVDSARGPRIYPVVINAAGNKADAYLERSVTYSSNGCSADRRDSQVKVELTNAMPNPKILGGEVTVRNDDPSKSGSGDTRVWLELGLPMGATVKEITLNGNPVSVSPVVEVHRPGLLLPVELPRNEPQTVVVTMSEPLSTQTPTVIEQPLSVPQKTVIDFKSC